MPHYMLVWAGFTVVLSVDRSAQGAQPSVCPVYRCIHILRVYIYTLTPPSCVACSIATVYHLTRGTTKVPKGPYLGRQNSAVESKWSHSILYVLETGTIDQVSDHA